MEDNEIKTYSQMSSEVTFRSSFETDISETDLRLKANTIKEYEIVKYLGKGSFSKVYLSKHLTSQRMSAMKIMEKSLIEELGKNDEIFSELTLLTRLKSPSVIKLFSAFNDEKNLFLEIELAENGDLREFIKNQSTLF